jgi:hypothetical protein
MSQLDDDVLTEFADVTTRIKTEFDGLQPSYPIRRKRFKRKPFVLVAAAGAIAASIVIGPSLSGSSNVNQLAWAATPTILSESQLQEIKSVCTDVVVDADYKVVIADERVERGFMLLSADRGPTYVPSERRFVSLLCQYDKSSKKFETPMIIIAETSSFDNQTGWGGPLKIGKDKVWIYQSVTTPETARVEITTAQGLVFDASVGNGFTFAWWPFIEETNSAGDAAKTGCTDAHVRYYDVEGNLIETFSMLTGGTTKP